jgi:hypothetical protein
MNKIATVSLCLAVFAHPLSALACNSPRDVAALKTAALQQRLMVAALTCKSTTAYNRFVLAHRAELQRSDADLKAYFIAQGGESGEAAYDTYKTKVANLAAHGPAIDARAFCASTTEEFDALSASSEGLMHALAAERMPANVCRAPVVTAAAQMPAARKAPAAVKVAKAEEVAGIAAAMPAMPYSAAPPPMARLVREAEPIDPADIVPPESYAEEAAEPADAYVSPRLAAAPERDAYDDYAPPRLAYAPPSQDRERGYDDYAPAAPRFARDARRGERYWYYRSLYARPRSWRD